MDPLTHVTTGALASRALADRFPLAGRLALLCVIAAIVPDLDSVVGLGPEAYLRHHRGFTHSFVGMALIAVPLAMLGKLLFRTVPLGRLYVLSYGIMLLHVYQDLHTTFGTQILWPFTDHRFAFPGTFIIDPFLTLGLIALLLLSLHKKKRVLFGSLGVALAVVYPLINFGIGSWVEQRLQKDFAGKGVEFVRLEATTDLLTPKYWKVIRDDGETLAIGSVSLSMEFSEPAFVSYPKPPPDLVESLQRQASIFRTWFWFAEYPVITSTRESEAGNRLEITFADLRFKSRSPVAQRIAPERRIPFILTALIDAEGTLLAYEYGDTLQKFLD
jgi:inner membrane protein